MSHDIWCDDDGDFVDTPHEVIDRFFPAGLPAGLTDGEWAPIRIISAYKERFLRSEAWRRVQVVSGVSGRSAWRKHHTQNYWVYYTCKKSLETAARHAKENL